MVCHYATLLLRMPLEMRGVKQTEWNGRGGGI